VDGHRLGRFGESLFVSTQTCCWQRQDPPPDIGANSLRLRKDGRVLLPNTGAMKLEVSQLSDSQREGTLLPMLITGLVLIVIGAVAVMLFV